jgi:hypothetical protein
MSTIVWCPSSGSAPVSPTPSAAVWTLHVNSVSRPLQFTRVDSTKTSLAYNPDAADHLVDGNSMIAQFVSDILPPQTIPAQRIGYGAEMLEVAASNNLFSILRLYGCNVLGTTNLGTLLAGARHTVELTTALLGSCRVDDGSAVTFNEPWRLVAEWGVGGLPVNTATDTHNASISFDTTFPVGAMVLPQDADGTNPPSVIVFSTDLLTTFGGPKAAYGIGI